MDFDGGVVAGTPWNVARNAGNPFTVLSWSMDAVRGSFSALELTEIITMWRMVAEDFVPFDIDVTTQDPGTAALQNTGGGDTQWGMHAYIGPKPVVSNPSPLWLSSGGIAYIGSFNDPIDNPCFVFNGDLSAFPENSLPDTVSHEVGHTLGLTHDGIGAVPPAPNYYSGHGVGNVSWGPIMGAPFGKSLTQWSMNTYPTADNPEDDLAVITTGNGFGYRPDDYGNSQPTAFPLNKPLQSTLKTTYGIIEKNTDFDYFSFFTNPGLINININALAPLATFSNRGANLDIQADLYNSAGTLIASNNLPTVINANISLNLAKGGLYYLRVSGAGLGGATGYPNYGSLGNYQITGTVVPYTPVLTVQTLNPVRWTYNAATRTYDGYLTINNLGASATGVFTIEITLPDSSMSFVAPKGATKNGNKYTLSYSGSFLSNKGQQILLKISNPTKKPLPTAFNAFPTVITQIA